MDILKKFRREEPEKKKEIAADGNLTRNQKVALVGLTVFGFFLVFFWTFSMVKNVNTPAGYYKGREPITPQLSEEDRQKTQDTDGDGLSDWNELNVYKTSPYLEDSDSDGIDDGDEVKAGENPNCPKGKTCGLVSAPSSEAKPPVSSGASGLDLEAMSSLLSSSSALILNQAQVDKEKTSLTDMVGGKADAATLRKYLLEAGMDKKLLDQLSDEVLMDSYQKMLQGGVSGE